MWNRYFTQKLNKYIFGVWGCHIGTLHVSIIQGLVKSVCFTCIDSSISTASRIVLIWSGYTVTDILIFMQ